MVMLLGLNGLFAQSQKDTLTGETAVVISASKWEQKLSEVPNKIIRLSQRDIAFNNPQTAADLLGQTGAVFVQKSQLAGGSPMIRGFATNRVLLVIDGVRMNNAIYRSGNLQNVISIDPLATQSAEVIFGPGSIIYGSDAIGGVMDFHGLQPLFAEGTNSPKLKTGGTALVRYSTANREQTYHADATVGSKKLAWAGSVTYSSFGDLQMGRNNARTEYLRPEYVRRINNRDSIIKNDNVYRQVGSGYEQWNVMQKIKYKPNDHLELQYNFYYGGTGTAGRYDRLIEYRNNALRFGRWDYGPMLWRMHTLQANLLKGGRLFNQAKMVVGYQNYEESRIDRTRNSLNQRTQLERVNAWSVNFDASKALGKGELYYGIEYIDNRVTSLGWNDHIGNSTRTAVASRYPDGSTWRSTGVYTLYKINFHPKWTTNAGLRYTYGTANATFSKTFVNFPFEAANLKKGAFTPSMGLVFRPAPRWQLSGHVSTGFRLPNVDDLGKLFESNAGNVIVPNPGLEPEYAWNFETGIAYRNPGKLHMEINGFHSRLENAIVRRPTTFQGQDSILFNGIKSRVEALQNIGLATVWGLQAMAEVWLARSISFYTTANWVSGKETDDVNNIQVPLRHAPPFYGQSGVKARHKVWQVEFFAQYNSTVRHEDLAPSEQVKTVIYAKDENGRTFAPGWYTLNVRTGFSYKNWMLTVTWENITNQMYRPYSSGVVAAGSNFIFALRYKLD